MKYPLLIKELLRKEADGTDSKAKWDKAFDIASDVALGVNSGMNAKSDGASTMEEKDQINVILNLDAATAAAEESAAAAAAAVKRSTSDTTEPLRERQVYFLLCTVLCSAAPYHNLSCGV